MCRFGCSLIAWPFTGVDRTKDGGMPWDATDVRNEQERGGALEQQHELLDCI